jgi:hypothetical protein
MDRHQSILEFSGGRYFKLAIALSLAAIGVYVWHEPPYIYLKPYGGTWLGYTLGTIGAVLILWLMLLGIRKRRYQSRMGTVLGWTSAHVYLGASLIVIVTLHCAFEFGWNIHTLAYVLMILVIASGLFGVYAYIRFPDDVNTLFMNACKGAADKTALRGSFWRQLKGIDPKHPMRVARDELLANGARFSGEEAKVQQQLIMEMTRIVALTDRIRRDLRIRALMQVWLYMHVPLAFALLAALIAHVVSVFYFW